MTEKLYYEDVEQLTFTARVLSCEARGDHFEAVLDRTAFFRKEEASRQTRGRWEMSEFWMFMKSTEKWCI